MRAKNQGRTNGKARRIFPALLLALLLLFNAATLGVYAAGEVPEEAAHDLSSVASFETGETEEAEEWVTLGKEKEPPHSAFWKEGDLSGGGACLGGAFTPNAARLSYTGKGRGARACQAPV